MPVSKAGYIESWGRGIEKIKEECILAGTSSPSFNIDFSGLMVSFEAKIATTSGKTSGKILSIIKDNAQITIPELASLISISERSIERNIQKLQKENRLERIGPAKEGQWRVME